MSRIEQIEKFLDTLDPKTLSLTDVKAYVDIAIAIEQYNSSKKLMKQYQKKGDRVILPVSVV